MASLIDHRDSDSSSENDMENLFHIIETEEEVFTFDSMTIRHLVESEEIEISFAYGVNRTDSFVSKIYMHIRGLNDDIYSTSLVEDLALRRMIFSLGMCTLHWFWMGFGIGKIEISRLIAEQVQLDDGMLQYWREVYVPMMAEFLYINRTPDKVVTLCIESSYSMPSGSSAIPISVEKTWKESATQLRHWQKAYSVIVPLGGGKDSLVVWQLEKEAGERPLSVYVSDGMFEFTVNWRLPALVTAMQEDNVGDSPSSSNISIEDHVILVKHVFVDENFKRLSRSYCEPCGHPWAAVVLFDTLIVAWLTDIPRISLGYEKSADEGNRVYVHRNTVEVNHQYDKSSDFVRVTQSYITKYIDKSIEASSKLSCLWELEIARIFCENPRLRKFHRLFLSCNEPVGHSAWCAKCDKCIFIALLLSAWLGVEYVTETVFGGKNLFIDPLLVPIFLRLVDEDAMKPMDCVGTVVEAREAVALILERETLPPLVLQEVDRFIREHPLKQDQVL